METKQKFISWRRVSTRVQGDKGLGMQAQADIIEHYAGKSGEIIADYAEVYTGTDLTGCKELQKAIKHCKRIGATLIIARIDRFRNAEEALSICRQLDDNIIFCDTPSNDRIVLGLMFLIAEKRALEISIATSKALERNRKNGVFSGRKAPKYGTGENYLINQAAGRIKCSETFVNKRLNNTETQTIIEAIAVAVPTIKEFDVEGSEYPFLGWWRAERITKEQWARVVELIKYAETRSATPLIEKEDWTLVDIKARFKYLFGTRFRPMAEKIYKYGESIKIEE